MRTPSFAATLRAFAATLHASGPDERWFAIFFHELKQTGVPMTPREYLTLMEAIEKDLAGRSIEEFYLVRRW
jgi:hypothetical protein